MVRRALAVVATALPLTLTPAAMAQESPQAVAGRILRQARDGGQLAARVIGTRWFLCREPEAAGVLEVTCAWVGPAEAPEGLSVRVVSRGLAPALRGRTSTTEVAVGWDGRVLSLSCEGLLPGEGGRPRALPGATARGAWQDGAFVVRAGGPDSGPSEWTLELAEDVLPGSLVGFVLTRLEDQGLPDDFTFRLLVGHGQVDEADSRLSRAGMDAKGRQILRCATLFGRVAQVRYEIGVARGGETPGEIAGARVDIWSREAPLFVAATQAEVEAAGRQADSAR